MVGDSMATRNVIPNSEALHALEGVRLAIGAVDVFFGLLYISVR